MGGKQAHMFTMQGYQGTALGNDNVDQSIELGVVSFLTS